jgi:6-pyruvoyltetrahydropterin/6-carboxytetrahydropterin synthase
MYQVVKKYGHEQGLSCAFRQWRATHSHCSLLHGYALAFEICFESDTLSPQNWVFDYGGLKPLKQFLVDKFDHTTCVSVDDPMLGTFADIQELGLIKLIVMPSVGCEATAKYVADWIEKNLLSGPLTDPVRSADVRLKYVTVSEHAGNSASYFPPVNRDH